MGVGKTKKASVTHWQIFDIWHSPRLGRYSYLETQKSIAINLNVPLSEGKPPKDWRRVKGLTLLFTEEIRQTSWDGENTTYNLSMFNIHITHHIFIFLYYMYMLQELLLAVFHDITKHYKSDHNFQTSLLGCQETNVMWFGPLGSILTCTNCHGPTSSSQGHHQAPHDERWKPWDNLDILRWYLL